jgi:hypothetical protein
MSTGPENPGNPQSSAEPHPAFEAIHDDIVDQVEARLNESPNVRQVMQAKPGGGGGGVMAAAGATPFGLDPSMVVRSIQDVLVSTFGNVIESAVKANPDFWSKWISDRAFQLIDNVVHDAWNHPHIMMGVQGTGGAG